MSRSKGSGTVLCRWSTQTYSLGRFTSAPTAFVASCNNIGSTPVTLGSNVPMSARFLNTQNSFYPRGHFVTRRSGWLIEIYNALSNQLVYSTIPAQSSSFANFPVRFNGLRDDSDDSILVPVRRIYHKIIDV